MKPMADWLTSDEASTAIVRRMGWFNYRIIYKRPQIVTLHEPEKEYIVPVRFWTRKAAQEIIVAMMVVQHDSRKALFRAISKTQGKAP